MNKTKKKSLYQSLPNKRCSSTRASKHAARYNFPSEFSPGGRGGIPDSPQGLVLQRMPSCQLREPGAQDPTGPQALGHPRWQDSEGKGENPTDSPRQTVAIKSQDRDGERLTLSTALNQPVCLGED